MEGKEQFTIIQKRRQSEEVKKELPDPGKKPKIASEGLDPAAPVRVYCDGVFDLFHLGHGNQLEYCKKLFTYTTLVVGVASDADVEKERGKPVMTQQERAETLKHCKWVDEVICPCPWVATMANFHINK